MPITTDDDETAAKQKTESSIQATKQQEDRLANDQYIIGRLDAGEYYEQARKLSDDRHNYLGNHVRSAVIETLGRERYKAFDELRIKKDGEASEAKVALHHSVGSQYALKGEDVIQFDIAGSGFRYPRMEQKGMTAWSSKDEYRDKELKVRWYNRIKPFTWLPGVKTRKEIEEINANREEMNRRIEEIYGERVDEKVSGRKLGHLRKKESVNDKGAAKTRFYLRGPNAVNIGKYSEDHLEKYILELGKSALKDKLESLEKLSDDRIAEAKPIHIMIQGHSRGGVASGLGAMRLKRWIADNHPRLLNKVQFDLLQYDPVAGGPENAGFNAEIDHAPADGRLSKKDSKYMSLGEEANTTVVYSLHTNHRAFFTPQKVKNPKRIILTMADHSVNLNQIDISQETGITRITYLAEKNGKVEAFRSSGLGELDEGVYLCDDQNNLIRLKSQEEYDAIAKSVLKGAFFQGSRRDVIRDSVKEWFRSHGGQLDKEQGIGEQIPENQSAENQISGNQIPGEGLKEDRISEIFNEVCSPISSKGDNEILGRISTESNEDSLSFKQLRSAVMQVKDLTEKPVTDAASLMQAMTRLSEAADTFYDTHRGHQYTDRGKEHRRACDLVRNITREFFDRMDIAMGGTGYGNITAGKTDLKYDTRDVTAAEGKMKELVRLYKRKKIELAEQGISAGDAVKAGDGIKARAKFFEPYEHYIDIYKASHGIRSWSKEIEEVIRDSACYRVQSNVLTKNHASKDAVSESKVKGVKLASLAEMEKKTEKKIQKKAEKESEMKTEKKRQNTMSGMSKSM